MDRMPDRGIDGYPYYSVDEIDVLTAQEIETAVTEWFDNLGLEEEIPDSIEVLCWEPLPVDYDAAATSAMDRLTEELYEYLDEYYVCEDQLGEFEISEERLEIIRASIIDAVKKEFKPTNYKSVRTISVNPRDYIDATDSI
ncbi:hypothetical protein [Sessilibacter corallicola]|uniref:hypothetical protein n=1 Tax=Sessilibacter corallicola TaxID=2904075 RepID=UPI001E2D3637|nr:hypothetical protein [Sessilibacter corallicola]MCE2029257.1 hypothetical protein [Sessilibacter corallicola]